MSERFETFAVGEHPRVEATTVWGDILVLAVGPGTVEVRIDGSGADRYRVESVGDTIVVEPERGGVFRRFSSADIVLKVPEGCDLELKAGSGDITVEPATGNLTISVSSGDVRARAVNGYAAVKAASGDVRLDDVSDWAQVTSASGDVRLGSVGGDARIVTASGDVRIDRVAGAVSIKAAAGDVDLRRFDGTDLDAKSLSGDFRIGIPPGRTLSVELETVSGDVRNELPITEGPPTGRAALRITTMSGDISLVGA